MWHRLWLLPVSCLEHVSFGLEERRELSAPNGHGESVESCSFRLRGERYPQEVRRPPPLMMALCTCSLARQAHQRHQHQPGQLGCEHERLRWEGRTLCPGGAGGEELPPVLLFGLPRVDGMPAQDLLEPEPGAAAGSCGCDECVSAQWGGFALQS